MLKLSSDIKKARKPFKNEYNAIYKAIKNYDKIVVFRHQMPDFDALGTQMGLVMWLKDNFPAKEIHYVGDDHVSFTPRLYPPMEIMEDSWFQQKFLAIVLDTGNSDRVSDNRFKSADLTIKIDHHPVVESFCDINLVNTTMAASSELVVNLLLQFPGHHKFEKQSAAFFFTGIAGDSGRFMYTSTTGHTFEIAKHLIATGFSLSRAVYQECTKKISPI
ncbi:MAG: DHH family phosphoesterase [Firmicutes bacterium]|nr:DHH family phosphoesterase [Bacillota bacterium]